MLNMNPAEESDGRAGPPTGLVWDPYNVQVVPAAAVLATSSQNVTVPFTTDTNPRCQVAGCTSSLGSMARYDVRYKVCSTHRRAEAVTHEGALQRFCQQHGVFHPLEAFEGTQRSCREGLARHNSKRRESRKGRAASSHGGSRRQGRRRRSSATRPSSEESEELLSSGTDLPRRESLRQQQRRARQETSDSGAYLAARQSSGLSPVKGGAAEPASFCSDELLDQGLPWDELEAPPSLPLPALELEGASAAPTLAGQVAPSLGLVGPFHQAAGWSRFEDPRPAHPLRSVSGDPSSLPSVSSWGSEHPSAPSSSQGQNPRSPLTSAVAVEAAMPASAFEPAAGIVRPAAPPPALAGLDELRAGTASPSSPLSGLGLVPLEGGPVLAGQPVPTLGGDTLLAPLLQSLPMLTPAGGSPLPPTLPGLPASKSVGGAAAPLPPLPPPPGQPVAAPLLPSQTAPVPTSGAAAPPLRLAQSAPTALLTRASFKLYETGPEELPRDIRSSLEHMIPAHVLEGFVRMGCVHVTLDCLVDCGATGSPPSGQSLLRGLANLAARPGWAAVPAMHVQVGGLLARAGRGVPDPGVRDLAGEGAPRVEAARRALPLPASRAVELRLTLHACDLRRDRLLLRSQGVYLEHKLLSVTHDGGGGAWHLVVEARLPSPIQAACIRCEVLAGDTLSEPLYLLVSTDEVLVKSLHEASRANPSPTALDGLLFALGLAGGRLRSREERRATGAAARRLALPALVAWNLHAALPLALRGACADCPPGELLAAVDDDLARAQPPSTALALALGSGPAAAIRLAKALSEAGCTVRLSHPLTLERVAACCGPHDAAQLLQLAADGPEARRRLSKEHPELGAAVGVDCHAPHSSLEEEVCSASSTGRLERDPLLAVEDTQLDACLAFVEPALEARFGTWFAERQGGTDTILLGLSMLSWVLGLLHSRHSTQGTAVLLGLSLVHAAVLVIMVRRHAVYAVWRDSLCVFCHLAHKVALVVCILEGRRAAGPEGQTFAALSLTALTALPFGLRARFRVHMWLLLAHFVLLLWYQPRVLQGNLWGTVLASRLLLAVGASLVLLLTARVELKARQQFCSTLGCK
ncbi:hypothetical protein ACKKBG_A36850 [Auxenochlorella protothecoides x Auxenochlorella symbiontica]